jgi:nitrite reductase/ring-hydroxylating ferredoxin subunit
MAQTDAAPGAQVAYPREYWHAAIAGGQLTDKPVGVQALDARLALFRDAEGRARAVQDRCAHRGVALRLGEVKEGALACPYHGWRYGGDGACVHIPSLADGAEIARGVGVRAYPCAEADGYVWVWMGQGAPDGPPPPIAEFDRFDWVQGSLTLACEALAAIENNLDWCHPVFSHPHTHGMFFVNQALGFRDQTIELRRTETGLVVFQPPTGAETEPVPPAPMVRLAYELPGRVTVATEGGPQGPMRIVMHMVPTGPATCRQEWMITTGPAHGSPKLAWAAEPSVIFEQDRALLETAQAAFDAEGHDFERSVEADAPTLMARRLYALACEGRWTEAADRLPGRRLLRVRT